MATRERDERAGTVDVEAVRQLLRELWRPALGWLLVLAGAVALVVGWFGVSREALVARQVPYFLSGGLGGVALVILGAVLVGSHDVNRFHRRLSGLEEKLDDLHAVLLVEGAATNAAANGHHGEGDGDGVVVLPEGEKYHERGCPVVTGKPDAVRLPRETARERGLEPCKLCAATTAATAQR